MMMKIEEMIQLMEAVNKNGIDKFSYEKDGEKVQIARNTPKVIYENAIQSAATVFAPTQQALGEKREALPTQPDIASDNVVTSPLVGTFYQAPAPGAPAFVSVGDRVKKGQILGIIEAMKLMNEIESEFDGVVEAILVGDGDVVEFGQALFRIR